MPWPFVARVRLEAALSRIEDLSRDRDYWRSKAEVLLDAGLQRAGSTVRPVMAPLPPAPPNPLAALMRGLAISEIDSSRPAPPRDS